MNFLIGHALSHALLAISLVLMTFGSAFLVYRWIKNHLDHRIRVIFHYFTALSVLLVLETFTDLIAVENGLGALLDGILHMAMATIFIIVMVKLNKLSNKEK